MYLNMLIDGSGIVIRLMDKGNKSKILAGTAYSNDIKDWTDFEKFFNDLERILPTSQSEHLTQLLYSINLELKLLSQVIEYSTKMNMRDNGSYI